MGGGSSKPPDPCKIVKEPEQQYYANNWVNSYQFHLDNFTIGTVNDYTLKNLSKENYHYLNQFILPDEKTPAPQKPDVDNPVPVSALSGKVESVAFVKSKMLEEAYFQKKFDFSKMGLTINSTDFKKSAYQFLGPANLKTNLPRFPKRLSSANTFNVIEAFFSRSFLINIIYKVWIIKKLVDKLSDENFKHISIKVRNTNVTIKNFKTKLMRKACEILHTNTLKQLTQNFNSTAFADSERRRKYTQIATTHRKMSDSEAYKKFFDKNALSKYINVSIPAILYLKRSYKAWKMRKFDQAKTNSNYDSLYKQMHWKMIPDFAISKMGYPLKAYIRVAEIKLLKKWLKPHADGCRQWDAYRNLLRQQDLPRPEFDPWQVSFLYHTNPDTYWKYSGFYHNEDFYYGVSTKFYPGFDEFCHTKTSTLYTKKSTYEWNGKITDNSRFSFSKHHVAAYAVRSWWDGKPWLRGNRGPTITKSNRDFYRETSIIEQMAKHTIQYHKYFRYYIPVKFCPSEVYGKGARNLSNAEKTAYGWTSGPRVQDNKTSFSPVIWNPSSAWWGWGITYFKNMFKYRLLGRESYMLNNELWYHKVPTKYVKNYSKKKKQGIQFNSKYWVASKRVVESDNDVSHVTWDESTVDVNNYLHNYLRYDTNSLDKYNKKLKNNDRQIIELEENIKSYVSNIQKTADFLPNSGRNLSKLEITIIRLYHIYEKEAQRGGARAEPVRAVIRRPLRRRCGLQKGLHHGHRAASFI